MSGWMSGVGALVVGVATPITVPDLGVDWAGSVTAVTTAATVPVVAALGLFAAFMILRIATRFLKRASNG